MSLSFLEDFSKGSVFVRNRYLDCIAISLSLHSIGLTMSFTFIQTNS
ncbi:MAG: hypothetical protein NZ992_03990 [Candidatus Korarchaeum sp.]|nr:hypothetical protein [Candidatus Korarchaeum sp.]MDW8034936.1 hypothetical protein [Candidatus Korarchaeum sp.]